MVFISFFIITYYILIRGYKMDIRFRLSMSKLIKPNFKLNYLNNIFKIKLYKYLIFIIEVFYFYFKILKFLIYKFIIVFLYLK